MTRPFRAAIVGTGPSGMYAVEHLLGASQLNVEIDLFERLPVPWGLVRYGVAPDHPEKKRISDRLFNNLISRENVRFFGNVEIGKDIQVSDLLEWYDSVIFASGAMSDKKLGIDGEELAGSWAAREFVAWYNGHPDYSHLQFDLSGQRAVIIGNGNVALDVARILCMPLGDLERTDIADHALTALRSSNIKEVVIMGRRSAANAAFNNPELDELTQLDNVDIIIDDPNFANIAEIHMESLSWENRRKVRTLQTLAQREPRKTAKRIIFKFVASPVEISGNEKVEALSFVRNITKMTTDGQEHLTGSRDPERLETELVFRAIGYRGTPFPGLPFDSKRAVIENDCGRIVENGKPLKGGYVTGWVKRGPRGVIGTNKQCAGETVSKILEDIASGKLDIETSISREDILQEIILRQPNFVPLSGWTAIDRSERRAGQTQNRARQKICNVEAMLEIAQA